MGNKLKLRCSRAVRSANSGPSCWLRRLVTKDHTELLKNKVNATASYVISLQSLLVALQESSSLGLSGGIGLIESGAGRALPS